MTHKIDRVIERWLGGHTTIGPMTIYGRNSMHWAINIKTRRWGYVCFSLPLRCFGRWWPLYLYVSPNATPWAATFMMGRDGADGDKALAPIRRRILGHNFAIDDEAVYQELRSINYGR